MPALEPLAFVVIFTPGCVFEYSSAHTLNTG